MVGFAVVTCDEATIVPQPVERPLDFPSLLVPHEHAAIVRGMDGAAALAVRCDQLNAVGSEFIPQRVRVGCSIVNQSRRMLFELMLIEQRLNQMDFGMIGCMQVDRLRQALPIDQQHQLGTHANLRGGDGVAPGLITNRFAATKVASAIATFQSTRPLRLRSCRTNRQSASHVPSDIHSWQRREHVGSEGRTPVIVLHPRHGFANDLAPSGVMKLLLRNWRR